MAFTHVITRSYRDSSSTTISSIENIVDDTELNFDGTVAGTTTNHEIDWTAVVANLKSLSIFSDQAITIKTNSSGSPQETITLVAGQNLVWTHATDGSGKIPFSGDITKLFVTNAGSPAANVKIRALAHYGN